MTPSLAARLRRLSEEAAALADELEMSADAMTSPPISDGVAGNWLSVAEVAGVLGVTKNAVRKRLKVRGIETSLRGGRVFVFSDDLSKLYSQSTAALATPPAALASFRDASEQPTLGLSNRKPSRHARDSAPAKKGEA